MLSLDAARRTPTSRSKEAGRRPPRPPRRARDPRGGVRPRERVDRRGPDGRRARDGGRDAAVRDGGRRDGGTHDGGSRDGGGTTDGGASDGGPRDGGTATDGGHDGGGAVTCRPAVGVLVIDEVMISSRSGSGDRGEWFEAVNTGTCMIDLTGVVIASQLSTGGESTHTITAGTVGPGQYFVFALSGSTADNHALPYDYAYGSGAPTDIIFDNTADWLELRDGASVVDRVAWPSGGFTHGHTRKYPGTASATGNDNWASWCDTTVVYSTTGGTFYGTPKLPNGTCP